MPRYYCTIGAQRALIYYSICQKWSSHKSYGAKSALASVSKRWNVSSKKGGPPKKELVFPLLHQELLFFLRKKLPISRLFSCVSCEEKHLLNDFLSGFLRQKCCVCLLKVCCLDTCHCHEASRFLLSASSSFTLRGYVRHQLSCLQQLR